MWWWCCVEENGIEVWGGGGEIEMWEREFVVVGKLGKRGSCCFVEKWKGGDRRKVMFKFCYFGWLICYVFKGDLL